jgi:hypothetical protein
MATPGVTLSEKYFHEFTFAKNLSNVRWLFGTFSFKKFPDLSGSLFAKLFLCRCSAKEKAVLQCSTKKNQSRFRQFGTGTAFNHQDGY